MNVKSWVKITPHDAIVAGKSVLASNDVAGQKLLVEVYRRYVNNYPKFFKMDTLCKLGFIASELLLNDIEGTERNSLDDRAIIMFNHSSSYNADCHFQQTIQDVDDFYPSPSVFVYTLPNIVTGEIAIRNKYFGETSFYVIDEPDARIMAQVICNTLVGSGMKSALCGWVECTCDDEFTAVVFLLDGDIDRASFEEEIKSLFTEQ